MTDRRLLVYSSSDPIRVADVPTGDVGLIDSIKTIGSGALTLNGIGGIAFQTNSSTVATLTTAGRLGIGTASPTYALDVSHADSGIVVRGTGSGARAAMFVDNTGGGGPYIRFQSDSTMTKGAYIGMAETAAATLSDDLTFNTHASSTWTERMRILNTNGRVGIGTTAPLGGLDVALSSAPYVIARTSSGARTYIVGGTTPYLLFWLDPTPTKSAYIGMAESGAATLVDDLVFSTSADGSAYSERMRIMNATGRVGIGTSGPLGGLDVANDSTPYIIARAATGTGSRTYIVGGTTPYLLFYKDSTPSKSAYIGMATSGASTISDDLTFNTSSDGSTYSERMRLVNGGNMQVAEGLNLQVGTSTGTKIGSATSQKLGFWNATPVVQQSAITAPSGGATQDAEARTAIGSILTLLNTIGLMA